MSGQNSSTNSNECVTEIQNFILNQCVWPFLKPHFDYWWCFDNNIQELRDGIGDLDRQIHDVEQKEEEAWLCTEKLSPGVEKWLMAATEKVAEARTLQDNYIPEAWNLISRYSMGKSAKKAADQIVKLRNDGNFNRIYDPASPPSMGSPSHIESRRCIEEEIMESLRNKSINMIAICGMGGVGKTNMVERIRKRVREEKLFDDVAMVVVGQQIDMLKLQQDIAETLSLNLYGKIDMSARAHQLRKRLMDTNRKIIILDDVRKRLELEDIGVPVERVFERCKILLTTRFKETCEEMKAHKVIAMEVLTKEEAWSLFEKRAGKFVKDPVLHPVAEQIAAECKGLPIALLTVGEALKTRSMFVLKDSLLRLSKPADVQEVLANFDRISDPASPASRASTSRTQTMDFKSREQIEKEIMKSLTTSSISTIAIWGMGGVGKTEMVHKIRKIVEDENLFDEVVMVVVGQQVDMLKIQKEIAELLGLTLNVESRSARAHQIRTRLMYPNRNVFLIFDDVWKRLKFEDLGIPIESHFERCKFLLTSRCKDVCEKMEVHKIVTMETLTEEEAWILFKEKAGNCVEDSALLHVAKDVAAECKGLPIALVTVGKILQYRPKSIWVDLLSQLRKSNPKDFSEVLRDVYKPLKLSYDFLDNEWEKLLFLLCCLFPEDYNIPVEQLTWYSMGLGIFNDITEIKDARARVHILVDKLKSRSLLIDVDKTFDLHFEMSGLHVKMQDVVRDVAIYIGSEEKDGFLKSLNESSIENSSDVNCNWMSLHSLSKGMEFPMGLRYPMLRLFMLTSSSCSNEFSDISFEGMEGLNVLSLRGTSLPPEPERPKRRTRIERLPQTLGLLKNLRTLCLFNCKVENISVIGELTGLEILCCNECYQIEELPAEIGGLNRLRLLELSYCYLLQTIPFGVISSLRGLEELKMLRSFSRWEAEENEKERRNASLRELECLPNLSCLEIEIDDCTLSAQEIRLPQKLVKYYIQIGSDDFWIERAYYEKEMNLNLRGAVGNWIRLLARNAESLTLRGDGSDNINLAEMKNLRNLNFSECSMVKKLVDTKDCKSGIVFPLLETLRLDKLENITELPAEIGSLSGLRLLELYDCQQLQTIPFGVISSLRQLEELKMRRSFSRWEAEKETRNASLTELKWLPNLSCLEIEIDDCTLSAQEICLSLNLVKYYIRIGSKPYGDEVRDYEKVMILNLPSHIGAVGNWIKMLVRNTEYLSLEGDCANNINLAETENLRNLRFRNCSMLKKLVETKDCKFGIVFPLLETLELYALENLEEICNGTIILNSLCNLKSISIRYCSKVRCLFSMSVARASLLQLEALEIENCDAMEQVFWNEITDDIDACIEFPKLKKLKLDDLPNLTTFCQGLENIKFPNLTDMTVGYLPKLNTLCPLNSEALDDHTTFHFLCNPKISLAHLGGKEIGGMMTSEREVFGRTGPYFLTSIDWNNSHHRRSIAASLVQGVYTIERDRQQNRQPLAPPWWEFFNFRLIQPLVDDHDVSYFGGIFEFNPPHPNCHYLGRSPPQYVIAFRGTIRTPINRAQDFKLNLHCILNNLHNSTRFNIGLRSVRSIVSKVGPQNVWLAGHSLGSSLSLLIGREMLKTMGIHLETYLFNPPFMSPPIERIESEDLKLGLRSAYSFLTAGLAVAVNAVKKKEENDPFIMLSTWLPYLFINPADPICSEYAGYFEHREKMESIGAGKIGRIATQHSMVSIVSGAAGKNSEAIHLIPSAHLTINVSRSQSFQEAHGIHQWWRPDIEFKYKLCKYK